MVVTAAVLASLLKDPLTKAFGWTFSEALKGSRNQKIEKSLQTLSSRITDVIRVKTIYKGDKSIDLHEFYVPTRVNDVKTKIACISDIDIQSIVLQGTVGQGKSIFMRYLTYQEAHQGRRIPIFFELRRLENSQSLQEAVSRTISNWIPSFSEEHFRKIAESGSIILFLDGFDEVPHEIVKRLLNEIEGWCERYPNMQLIISARPESEIEKSNFFKVYRLSSYRFHEQFQLIDKLVEEEKSQEILKQAIRESAHEIQELLTTPLMVTLFVMTYRALSEIPENQSEFYKSLFSVLTSRHDKTKPGYKRELSSNLNESQLQGIFEEFCFITGNRNKLVIDYSEAIQTIKVCLFNQNFDDNPADIIDDFSKVVCLLLKDGLNYSFVHKSIQEYFYSSFISKKSEQAQQKFYFEYSKNVHLFYKTRGVAHFLKESNKYNYYKYFKLPILKEYISFYNITRVSNDIISNLYINFISEDKVEVILNDSNEIYSGLFCAPEGIEDLLGSFIKHLISKGQNNFAMYGYGKLNINDGSEKSLNIEDFQKLSEALDTDKLAKIESEIIDITNNILDFEIEITRYIEQKDSIDIDMSDLI